MLRTARFSVFFLPLFLLCACVSGPSSPILIPTAVHQTSQASGEGVIGSVFIGMFAFTTPIRWNGEGSITLQYPAQPYVVLDGTFVWEPIYPEQRSQIEAAVAAGVIRVSSSAGATALSATGTIP